MDALLVAHEVPHRTVASVLPSVPRTPMNLNPRHLGRLIEHPAPARSTRRLDHGGGVLAKALGQIALLLSGAVAGLRMAWIVLVGVAVVVLRVAVGLALLAVL